MHKTTTIIIADDHSLVRKGLRQVLETLSHVQIYEAEEGETALKLARERKPHIIILDIEMPKLNGFDVAKQIQRESLKTDVIFLTMFKEENVFNKAMDIGVKGYVLKENTVAEIVQCITAVQEGKYYLSPSISEFLVRRNNKLVTPATETSGIHLLTTAEKNILKLLATMKTNMEIAEELHISIKTVHNHRNNICNKLGLSGAHALLKFAVEHIAQL